MLDWLTQNYEPFYLGCICGVCFLAAAQLLFHLLGICKLW